MIAAAAERATALSPHAGTGDRALTSDLDLGGLFIYSRSVDDVLDNPRDPKSELTRSDMMSGLQRSRLGRRVMPAAVVLACGWLVGCFPIDHQAPVAYLYNEWDGDVTLTLVGIEEPQEVSAGESHVIRGADGDRLLGADDCYGAGFVLTQTANGQEIGRSDEPVCGGTIITVMDDGTLR